MRSSCELLQESHVRIVEQSYVGNTITLHRHSAGPHPERPSSVSLAIDARGVEYGWMHHSRAEDFGPAGISTCRTAASLAHRALDVHLRRRLGEWKEARTKTRASRAEEAFGEMSDGCFEVDEAYVLVDGKPFELRKNRGVRRIEEITTINISWCENANRRLVSLKSSDLDG